MGSSTSAKWFTLRRQARWASRSGERLAVRADVRAALQEPYAPHKVTRVVVCQNCTARCMWGNRESWSTTVVTACTHEHIVPVNTIPPNNKTSNVLHSNRCSSGVSKYLDDGNKMAAVYEPRTHILIPCFCRTSWSQTVSTPSLTFGKSLRSTFPHLTSRLRMCTSWQSVSYSACWHSVCWDCS